MADTPKIFPIMTRARDYDFARDLRNAGYHTLALGVPWGMIAPHEGQALKNHSQTLARLAQRGGLAPSEALAVLNDRGYRRMNEFDANEELLRDMNLWRLGFGR